MTLTDEKGTHEIDDEFVFGGVNYHIEGTITNTIGVPEKCEKGYPMPSSSEDHTEIELLSATFGVDNEYVLEDIAILKAIETELYNYI